MAILQSLTLITVVHLIILHAFCSRQNGKSCVEASEFNVLHYGAIADGRTDSTDAFQRAWLDACRSTQSTTLYVPNGSFLVRQIQFNGPCQNNPLLIDIDGTIVSPDYTVLFDPPVWIGFSQVNGVNIQGGILEGRGKGLWDCKSKLGNSCPHGTKSLQITGCDYFHVTGLTSIDSQLVHVFIENSNHVTLQNLHITAPENSPNTDGIHVTLSNHVNILESYIATGDDCISIGRGTTHLRIENVNCGPGHGISIGSLGKSEQDLTTVRNISVLSCTFTNTQNGLRIKTYPTDYRGHVRDVRFEHNIMINVQNPIVIDQHYCNGHAFFCTDVGMMSESGIEVNGISYINIQGTSTGEFAVNFNCSKSMPCRNIHMEQINIINGRASCHNAYGTISGMVTPPNCLLGV